MAPRHCPLGLYAMCLRGVAYQVDKTARRLFLEHGSFEDCRESIQVFQSFLCDILPTTVFEDLCDIRNFVNSYEDESFRSYCITSWLRDPRIKLSIYLYPGLSRFTVDPDGNELPQNLIDGMDEIFWCRHLSRLNNLTSLRLNMITTDEILSVVGRHCPKLKHVNIVSKIRESTIRTTHSNVSTFCLMLCVSDVGLYELAKCKDLQSIIMNKIIPSLVDNTNVVGSVSGISINGVRHLVKSLPKLEHLNFGSMGRVIDAGFDPDKNWPLKIKYFCEMNPEYVNIPMLEKSIPYVEHVSLTAPFSVELVGDTGRELGEIARSNAIFESLAESSILKPKVYEFHSFPCAGERFKKFILCKGKHIEELTLRSIDPVSFKEICLIGEECPYIRCLTIRGLQGVSSTSVHCGVDFYHRERKSTAYRFKHITTLVISGKSWNPNLILPYILRNAKNVSKISLLNTDCRYTLDAAWEKILKDNPLSQLNTLMLYTGCFISFILLKKVCY
ncbi:uncharacterized protein [Lepeophtheirus salmonis]|uniref:uncharacterized protein n=1 Tax=Lepeophtheirus salmonis TaxID=72036 RepID=UPI001AE2CFBE|nr:uncharacterized protein LOC121127640 [Lepeophtheirus salmonis]